MPTKKEARAAAVVLARKIAYAADNAAEHAGDMGSTARDLERLRKAIVEQEKGHRRFVSFGPGTPKTRATYDEVTCHFVARVLAAGALTYHEGKANIASLAGIREDYVRGAILMATDRFREKFYEFLKAEFPHDLPLEILTKAQELDYCLLAE